MFLADERLNAKRIREIVREVFVSSSLTVKEAEDLSDFIMSVLDSTIMCIDRSLLV